MPEYRIQAYRYGLFAPLNWDADCEAQIEGQRTLWNALVEQEREHQRRYREIIATDPRLQALEGEIEQCRSMLAETRAQRRVLAKTGKHGRRGSEGHLEKADRQAENQVLRAHLDLIKARMTPLINEARTVRADVRARLKPELEALRASHWAAVKVLRQQAAASGLWWGHYNAVLHAYETARSAALKAGVELRFKGRYTPARLTVPLQIGTGKPPASVPAFLAGRRPEAWIEPLSPEAFAAVLGSDFKQCEGSKRQRRGVGLLHLTVASQRATGRRRVRFPIILDRPLPEEGEIKQIVVTRTREGLRTRWACSMTLRLPAFTDLSASGTACGINLGFKQTPAGLRVATLVGTDGQQVHLCLSPQWLARMDYAQAIRSRMDQEINDAWQPCLAGAGAWVEANPALSPQEGNRPDEEPGSSPQPGNNPEDITLSQALARMKRAWRPHARHLVILERAWTAQAPLHAPEVLDGLRRVLIRNRLWMIQWTGLRQRGLRHRREVYRHFARDISLRYAQVALDDLDLRQLAVLPKDEPHDLPQPGRAQRVRAALHELRSALRLALDKQQGVLARMAGKTTHRCHVCGAEIPPTRDPTDLILRCARCDSQYDRDFNAACVLRDWITGRPVTDEVAASAFVEPLPHTVVLALRPRRYPDPPRLARPEIGFAPAPPVKTGTADERQ